MQVMSVKRAYNELKNTKDWQSEIISESNMIWNQMTLRKVLEFEGNVKTNLIILFSKCFSFFFFYQRPKTNAKQIV